MSAPNAKYGPNGMYWPFFIIFKAKSVIPMSAHLTGQYGMEDLYIGVPCILGPGGVEEILELDLLKDELDMLQASGKIYKESLKFLGY